MSDSILDFMPVPDKEVAVFTPRVIVKEMVDALPDDVWNYKTKFLDIACKSGIFLEEILNRLMELDYWKEKYSDEFDRRIAIAERQLFGISPNPTCQMISERVVYGVLLGDSNIKYIEDMLELAEKNKLVDEIKKEFKDMKFDVIIGNPPYQKNTGGGGVTETSSPIYNKFIEQAMKMNAKYISMIVPSRWCSTDKSELNKLRKEMVECQHISSIFNFENSKEVFDDLLIAGGVMYFLYDNTRKSTDTEFNRCSIINGNMRVKSTAVRELGKYRYKDKKQSKYMILTDNMADSIVTKVLEKDKKSMYEQVLSKNVFNIPSNFTGSKIKSLHNYIGVVTSKEKYYINSECINRADLVNKTKVIIGQLVSGGGFPVDGRYQVLSRPRVLDSGDVCSHSYLVVGCLSNEYEANNLVKLLKTKIVRYLIKVTLSSMNISKKNFIFVPLLDYTKEWTDEELYERYKLSQEEIDYIENTIKEM